MRLAAPVLALGSALAFAALAAPAQAGAVISPAAAAQARADAATDPASAYRRTALPPRPSGTTDLPPRFGDAPTALPPRASDRPTATTSNPVRSGNTYGGVRCPSDSWRFPGDSRDPDDRNGASTGPSTRPASSGWRPIDVVVVVNDSPGTTVIVSQPTTNILLDPPCLPPRPRPSRISVAD
jgi:hypothetical protein